MPGRRHILLIDSQPLFRDGLVAALSAVAGHIVCHAADGSQAALAALDANRHITLVAADFSLREPRTGIELLELIGARHPAAFRVLTGSADHARLGRLARRHQLDGYLSKHQSSHEWVRALLDVIAGKRCLPAASGKDCLLTDRQLEILKAVARGMGNREIGLTLGLTERNVKYHLREACLRLGAGNRTEAVMRASTAGLIRMVMA